MNGGPFHILLAKSARKGLYSAAPSSARRAGSAPLHRTTVNAALSATHFGRRLMIGSGGFAEVEAVDGPSARPALRRPVTVPPFINREDNWI